MVVAQRVFVSISPKSQFWPLAGDSAAAIVGIALDLAKKHGLVEPEAHDPRLLVEERWGPRTHIVFDLHHDDYDADTAHLPGHNHLPVVVVFLSASESAQAASKLLEDRVNREVGEIHGSHTAGVQPPFIVDHTGGKIPCYPSPRAVCIPSCD
jgi:hypothetical protein